MDDHFVGYEAGFTARRHTAEACFAGKRSMGQPVAGDCIESWSPDRGWTVREGVARSDARRTMPKTMAKTMPRSIQMLLARHRARRVAEGMSARRRQTGVCAPDDVRSRCGMRPPDSART
jgi:hypothetical protein